MIARKRPALDAEVVVTVALELLGDAGFDGLTVRRLAERLGVANPALYWHFRNKQQIVDKMAERLLASIQIEVISTADWRGWLTRVARGFRRVMLSHRDGARVIASADLSQGSMSQAHPVAVRRLTAAGFSAREALIAVTAVVHYTMGATFEQQADPIRSRRGGDAIFEGGLGLILDGLAQQHRGRSAKRGRGPAA